jgi:DNA-binding FadR family transcriptional regulator
MNSFQPVSATRLYRMIADQIARRIRVGDFKPGERLPSERELAEQLQVSRPSVREALIALEISGYVEVKVGTGVYVAQRNFDQAEKPGMLPSVKEVGPFDLLAVRLLVEPESAALAAANANGVQLAAMETAHQLLQSGNPRDHDRAFHLAIAEGSGNRALINVISHILHLRDDSAVLHRLEEHFVTSGVWKQVVVEHAAILNAIAGGDVEGARQAMQTHLENVMERLRIDFGNSMSEMKVALISDDK